MLDSSTISHLQFMLSSVRLIIVSLIKKCSLNDVEDNPDQSKITRLNVFEYNRVFGSSNESGHFQFPYSFEEIQ